MNALPRMCVDHADKLVKVDRRSERGQAFRDREQMLETRAHLLMPSIFAGLLMMLLAIQDYRHDQALKAARQGLVCPQAAAREEKCSELPTVGYRHCTTVTKGY